MGGTLLSLLAAWNRMRDVYVVNGRGGIIAAHHITTSKHAKDCVNESLAIGATHERAHCEELSGSITFSRFSRTKTPAHTQQHSGAGSR